MFTPDTDPTRRQFMATAGASLLAMSMMHQPTTQLAPPDQQPPKLKVPPDPQKKAGWAVVGLGTLAINEVLPAFAQCDRSRLVEVTACAHQPTDDPRFADFPESYVWTMRFPSGVLANCACGFGGHESRRYRVNCADEWIDLDPAYSYSGQQLIVSHRNRRSEIKLPHVNHFASEMDHFSECVLEGKDPWTPGEEGLADLKVIDAINRAVASNRAEKV